MIGIDDRRDDVAAESGTDLIEQVLVDLARLILGMRADFEARAVGRQTAVQRRRNSRTEVAAHWRGSEQRDLGLFLLENAADDRSVRQRAVGRETLAVGYVHDIGAVLGQLLFDAGESLSERERLELAAQRIGQRAALGQ